jgi:hydrogenase maturation protease
MTDEVLKAAVLMERVIIKYIEDFGVSASIKSNITLEEASKYTYIKGVL